MSIFAPEDTAPWSDNSFLFDLMNQVPHKRMRVGGNDQDSGRPCGNNREQGSVNHLDLNGWRDP